MKSKGRSVGWQGQGDLCSLSSIKGDREEEEKPKEIISGVLTFTGRRKSTKDMDI